MILAFLNYIFYHTKTQLEQSDIAKMKDHPMPKVCQMFHNTNMATAPEMDNNLVWKARPYLEAFMIGTLAGANPQRLLT